MARSSIRFAQEGYRSVPHHDNLPIFLSPSDRSYPVESRNGGLGTILLVANQSSEPAHDRPPEVRRNGATRARYVRRFRPHRSADSHDPRSVTGPVPLAEQSNAVTRSVAPSGLRQARATLGRHRKHRATEETISSGAHGGASRMVRKKGKSTALPAPPVKQGGIVKFRGWKKSGGVGLLETVDKDGSSDHLLNPARSVQRSPLF
jgi:hypothetical protein